MFAKNISLLFMLCKPTFILRFGHKYTHEYALTAAEFEKNCNSTITEASKKYCRKYDKYVFVRVCLSFFFRN